MDSIQPNVTGRNQKKSLAPLADLKALSVNQFCDVHGISRRSTTACASKAVGRPR